MTRWYIDERMYVDEGGEPMALMYNEYEDQALVPDVYECDICGEDGTPITQRYHVLSRRPSTGEMTEVMWVCRTCASTSGAERHGKDCTHE